MSSSNAIVEHPKQFKNFLTQYDPTHIVNDAQKLLEETGCKNLTPESPLFKALSLQEFENGLLMTTVVSEQYKTFVIDLTRRIRKEFACQSVIEKALCESVAISFVRTLEVQRKLNHVLEKPEKNKTDLMYLAILSKELDRAHRHYISAIQTLQYSKQPQMIVKVQAQTAVVGQQQVVQSQKQ